MKYLLILPLVLLTGCNKFTELNDNVNYTTDIVMQNAGAIQQSTQEIRHNTQLIEESTRVMKENHEALERMKNS
jgi:hypothetical protein